MKQQSKILCISLGSIGKRHLRNARALLPDAHITVCRLHTPDAPIPEGADHIIHSMSAALVSKFDAVIVASPTSTHIVNALPFAERQIPLFIEKPLAERAENLSHFVQQCQKSQGFCMTGYVLRFLPALHCIRELINNDALGDIYTACIEVGQYLPDWRPGSDYRTGVSAQAKLGGGALLELSHEIDYATWLFGFPNSLQCVRGHLSKLDIDVEDSAHVLMEYPDKYVSLQLDFLQRVPSMTVQIVGSKATLKADLIKEEIVFFTPEYPEGKLHTCEKLPDGNDIYLRQFDFFFQKALPEYKPRYENSAAFTEWASVAQAAAIVELVDLAKKASDTGIRQNVPLAKVKAA